jgi:hypothetical protein
MNIRTVKMIDCQEFDELVKTTYGRPYCFQQQNGCQARGIQYLTVPDDDNDEYMNDDVPEEVNGDQMGVKFATWLARDPAAPLKTSEKGSEQFDLGLFWERNFYPDIQTVANDLHKKDCFRLTNTLSILIGGEIQ